MSIWRSSVLTSVRLALSESSSRVTLSALDGLIHLIDMNVDNGDEATASEFTLGWKRRALACIALINRLDTIGELMVEYEVEVQARPEPDLVPLRNLNSDVLETMQNRVSQVEVDLKHHTDVLGHLERDIERLLERVTVLSLYRALEDASEPPAEDTEMDALLSSDASIRDFVDMENQGARRSPTDAPANLGRVCGCIVPSDRIHLERMIYRVSRGNAHCVFDRSRRLVLENLTRAITLKSKGETGIRAHRLAFCVFVVGRHMELKVRQVISLMGTLHEIPQNVAHASEIQAVVDETRDAIEVLRATETHITTFLKTLAQTSFQSWCEALNTELAICRAMQNCKPLNIEGSKTVCIQGWVYNIDLVREALSRSSRDTGVPAAALQILPIRRGDVPPTHFRLNSFTSLFQQMINTYGVPRYREVNPAVFTAVTFPFCFGMMFGDVGHGSILFALAIYLQFRGRQLSSAYQPLYQIRFLLFLMGFFAIYCGAIYNEIFGFGLSLRPSGWDGLTQVSVYPFGVDPAWHGSINELPMLNSIKMKLSIVFGIAHMSAGIFLSAVNHITFSDKDALLTEFVPQLLFLWASFGYMAVLIIVKFTIDWAALGTDAPSIIQTMIGLFIMSDFVEMFPYQTLLQAFLRLVMVLCIPTMLFGKPYLRYRAAQAHRTRYMQVETESADAESNVELQPLSSPVLHRSATSDSFGSDDLRSPRRRADTFGDDMLHQAIHTIEFVLGAVSNTASYLRLWALSLAHQQLSLVFLEHILMPGWRSGNPILILICTTMWVSATLGVLCGMDTMECLLHALRLHWVEFQSKFYYADGTEFTPFSLTADVSEAVHARKSR